MDRNMLNFFAALSILGLIAGCGNGSASTTTLSTDVASSSSSSTGKLSTPAVTATVPSNGQTNVAAGTTISATFSMIMKFATINSTTFKVTDNTGNPVPGTISFTGLNAVFTPNAPLNGTYTVSLSGIIESKDGNGLKPMTYSFTTLPIFDVLPPALAAGTYSTLDSTQPGGPVFVYEDISATGTDIVALHVDDTSAAVPLPFPITIFGTQYTTINISTNGYITAISGDGTFVNYPFPATGNPRIAPYFDDLWPIAPPNVTLSGILSQVKGTAPNRFLVVQWFNLEHFTTRGDGRRINFEVILYENNHDILFQYQNVSNFAAGLANGASATVGLNKGDGITASQYSFNSPSLANGLAIRFKENSSLSPESGTSNVPVTTAITAVFNEALLPASIISPATTFSVATGGNPIAGTVTFSGVTATFTPSSNLLPNTLYTATIGTAASDLNNNPLPSPITWSFTTAP